MPRKYPTRRLTLDVLEPRTLMSTGLADDIWRNAQPHVAVAAIHASGTPAAEVAHAQNSAKVAVTQQHGRGGQQAHQLLQQRLKRQHQQQLRAQGKILSARSLDSTTIEIRLKQKVSRPLDNVAMYRIPGLTVEQAIAGSGGVSVILKTSPQSDTTYALTMVAAPVRGKATGKAFTAKAFASSAVTPQPAQTLGKITFTGTPAAVTPPPPINPITPPNNTEPPRVVSATSFKNTEVVVQFSEPMSDRALVAQYYEISTENVRPESGRLIVRNARFQEIGTDSDKVVNRSTVILTTESQSELDYHLRVANVVDTDGNPIAPAVLAGGQRIDPAVARFQGTPPSADEKNGPPTLIDSDEDGLSDNEEQSGWLVTVINADGSTSTRSVTSDINLADTDADGLTDKDEARLGIDPRNIDTDADQLTDWQENKEIFSNPLSVDTDRDGADDYAEFVLFKTSPFLDDTDGDQETDGTEVFANRNPRVAELPRPEITVGDINLQLDVRFTETDANERRDLDAKSVTSTLSTSESKSLTKQFTANVEAHLEVGLGDGSDSIGPYVRVGGSAGFTYNQSEESASETARSYEQSLNTEKEVTSGRTVEREVTGAVMQAAVSLRNVSNLAYRVKNLQVTAFIQDPLDHARLKPVATLLPDSEPADGFTLGPLMTDRGPIIFANSTIVPTLVESLMKNSSGLIFRISNYDIINEDGRNFAFASQDVVERTTQVVIDYGGARNLRAQVIGQPIDPNQPGDETEIYRVATSAGRPIDTNGDNSIDGKDRRVIFDPSGNEVGISLYEGLFAIGLTRYEARYDPATNTYLEYEPGGTTPVNFTNQDDAYLSSFSTFIDDRKFEPTSTNQSGDSVFYKLDPRFTTGLLVHVEEDSGGLHAGKDYFIRQLGAGSYSFYNSASGASSGDASDRVDITGDVTAGVYGSREKIYRIRGVANDAINQKYWESLTPLGIDQVTDLKGLILLTNSPVSLNYVQDLDQDGLPADVEFFLRTSDSPMTAGAVVPGTTDTLENSVSYGTDPGFSPDPSDPSKATGTLVRVTATGGGLTAGENYVIQYLRNYAYSFKDKKGNLVHLTDTITSGVFATYKPVSTDVKSQESVRFQSDPGFATATVLHVTGTGGGLTADTDYFIRNLGDGSYSFFTSAEAATAGVGSTTGRIDLSADITASIFNPTAHGRDTDGDGLDDRFEALIGWTVSTPLKTYKVYSAPNRADSNFDAPKPGVDSTDDGKNIADRLKYEGSDGFAAPAGWNDRNSNGLRDRFEVDQKPTQNGVTDYVLDPLRRDTDGDGINDATEIIGFKITPITFPVDPPYWVTTNPISPDTDSDTFSDGFEQLVGLNPTIGTDRDEDGDGLPDIVEEKGWSVLTHGVSTTPYVQDGGHQSTRTSSPNSVDTDEDGLTDYEEFFLHTDPSSKDSDRDGIDDRVEYLGYALGHKVGNEDIGNIKTDPLDADTDNDMRSDGDEAELKDVELKRWVVRATGAVKSGEVSTGSAYQVFSNPLVADADFDGLVDGQEFADLNGDGTIDPGSYRTDPNNSNTDGDKRDDGVEFKTHTNPLVEDFMVTVFFNGMTITDDGNWDPGDHDGDFAFDFGVRFPGDGAAGLGSFQSVVHDTVKLVDPFKYQLALTDQQVEPYLPNVPPAHGQGALTNNQNSRGIAFDGSPPTTLTLARYPDVNRSITFGMTPDQAFSIEGIVAELDLKRGKPNNSDQASDYNVHWVYLGGVDGLQATKTGSTSPASKQRAVFRGSDFSTDAFFDYKINFENADNLDPDSGDPYAGYMSFTIFVG